MKGIICFGMGLTLREGNREYFYSRLDRHVPGLKEVYIRRYGNAYDIPSPRQQELMALFHSFCQEHGILHDNRQIFRYLHRFEDKTASEQLSIF